MKLEDWKNEVIFHLANEAAFAAGLLTFVRFRSIRDVAGTLQKADADSHCLAIGRRDERNDGRPGMYYHTEWSSPRCADRLMTKTSVG